MVTKVIYTLLTAASSPRTPEGKIFQILRKESVDHNILWKKQKKWGDNTRKGESEQGKENFFSKITKYKKTRPGRADLPRRAARSAYDW